MRQQIRSGSTGHLGFTPVSNSLDLYLVRKRCRSNVKWFAQRLNLLNIAPPNSAPNATYLITPCFARQPDKKIPNGAPTLVLSELSLQGLMIPEFCQAKGDLQVQTVSISDRTASENRGRELSSDRTTQRCSICAPGLCSWWRLRGLNSPSNHVSYCAYLMRQPRSSPVR